MGSSVCSSILLYSFDFFKDPDICFLVVAGGCLGKTRKYSRAIPSSVLRNDSRWCFGDHILHLGIKPRLAAYKTNTTASLLPKFLHCNVV